MCKKLPFEVRTGVKLTQGLFVWLGMYLEFILFSWFGGLDVLVSCLFFGKELKVGWVGRGEELEEVGEGKNTIKVYLNLKVVLINKQYINNNF